jgi:hypothetical protein
MSWEPNTPWQTCTHPLDARKELPHLDNGNGTVLVQYDCLNCGSMLSVDMDRQGNVIQQWDWVPPEEDRPAATERVTARSEPDTTVTFAYLEFYGAVFETHDAPNDVAILPDGTYWYVTQSGDYIIGGYDADQ